MITIKKTGIVTGALGLLLSTLAIAADSNPGLAKDTWLKALKDVAGPAICKSFTENDSLKKQLMAANINYDKCLTLIPASYDKCQAKLYDSIPATVDESNAQKWGNSIGECIGGDFAVKYLVGSTPSTTTTTTTTSSSTTSGADTTSSEPIAKDAWLGKLKIALPGMICNGFLQDESLKKQMATMKIDYDKCVTLLPASIDKCSTELYSNIPATLDNKAVETWGNNLGECIGKDFATKHLI